MSTQRKHGWVFSVFISANNRHDDDADDDVGGIICSRAPQKRFALCARFSFIKS